MEKKERESGRTELEKNFEMHCEAQAVRWSSLAMNEEREKS
jgi:hypothetical protein